MATKTSPDARTPAGHNQIGGKLVPSADCYLLPCILADIPLLVIYHFISCSVIFDINIGWQQKSQLISFLSP